MTEIDFGTLVTAVVNEMNCTASELFGDEVTDRDLAAKRYSRNVIGAIRQVFDEAEARVDVPATPTCSRCGAILEEGMRFCTVCGTPQTVEATGELLERALAKDAGTTPDDPRFRASLARLREEEPEVWNAVLQKIAPLTKA